MFTSAKPISDTLEFSRLVADIRFDFRQSDSVTQIWWGRLAVSCAFVLLIRVVCLPATGALWFVDFTDAVAAGIGLLNLFFLVGLQRKIVPKHWLFSKGRVTRSGKMWLLGIFTERLQHEDVEIKEWRLQGLPCAAATTQHLLTLARELQAQYRLKVQQRADLMPLFDILASGLLAMCWLATVFAQFTSAVGF